MKLLDAALVFIVKLLDAALVFMVIATGCVLGVSGLVFLMNWML